MKEHRIQLRMTMKASQGETKDERKTGREESTGRVDADMKPED